MDNSRAKYKNPKNYKFNCVCGKNFNIERSYRSHKKKIHNIIPDTCFTIKEKNCPLCNFKSCSKPELIEHFETTHDLSIVQEKHVFESKEQFLTWKNELESKTLSRFVLARGFVKFKTHVTYTYMCHRSGYYTPVGKGSRHLKTQGSAKINGFCPAAIQVKLESDGHSNVLYTASHVGHNNELKHLTLTSAERKNIARKMSLKIPFDDILDEIRDSTYDSDLQRIQMLTRQDLYNIETSFNLTSKTVRHKDDALNVDSCLEETETGNQDCIRNSQLDEPEQNSYLEQIDGGDQDCIRNSQLDEPEQNSYLEYIDGGDQDCIHNSQSDEPKRDFLWRRDELIKSYLRSIQSIALPEQLEYMESHFLPVNSTLAAIKDAHNSKIHSMQVKNECCC